MQNSISKYRIFRKYSGGKICTERRHSMQIDDILLLRMNRQYLFTPAADELAVLRGICGLQAQFYGN